MTLKKTYFASDFHLGIPDAKSSSEREQRIIKWLNEIKPDCAELFIVGDIFDFWFEYKTVVPKGFVRLQAKFAEFTDAGIPVHFFHGNHDLWQFGYFEKELGVQVHEKSIIRTINGKNFYIGHGDGLGPEQRRFKTILWIYRNRFFQKIFSMLHPNIGIGVANWLSHQSKLKTFDGNFTFYEEKEFLIRYCRSILQEESFDYFVFGHRHLPMEYKLTEQSRYVNLGDWIGFNTYAVFNGETLSLQTFHL
ncbi:MAG: UDP-2,3-diacylglucosamine diphosphatase [Bacteroidota bacterium]